jgi:hypothetical protein
MVLGLCLFAGLIVALLLSQGHPEGCEHAVGPCDAIIVEPSWRGPALATLSVLALVSFMGAWMLDIVARPGTDDE